MNVHELEWEEIRKRKDLRRKRIAAENEIIRKKIEANNELTRQRIAIEFNRKCKAVAKREKELEERSLRLTKNSPFHNDDYAIQTRNANNRKFREAKAREAKLINDTVKNMTGKPEFDPVTQEMYKALNPESQLAMDLRRLQQRKRIVCEESTKLNDMSATQLEKLGNMFPVVAMEVDRILDPLGLRKQAVRDSDDTKTA